MLVPSNLNKLVAILLLSVVFFNTSKAQSSVTTKTDSIQIKRAQNLYLEFGGAALFISANYDTRLSQQRDGLGARIGVGAAPAYNGYPSYFTVPLQLNYLWGKKSNFLELGLGGVLLSYSKTNTTKPIGFRGTPVGTTSIQGISTIGYRYQPVKSGFSFRATLNPLFNSNAFVPFDYAGLSFGYTF